jgi:hypothetical protein
MINNHLLKFSAKEYYLKAGLCRMASGDSIGAAVRSGRKRWRKTEA